MCEIGVIYFEQAKLKKFYKFDTMDLNKALVLYLHRELILFWL